MEEDSNKAVAAEISVNDNGGVYIGVKAKQSLGLLYNDNIEVTIPDIGRVIEGSLSSASQISTTQKTVSEVKEFGDKTSGATWHIEAIIEKVSGTWDDDHALTQERSEPYFTLDSKDL